MNSVKLPVNKWISWTCWAGRCRFVCRKSFWDENYVGPVCYKTCRGQRSPTVANHVFQCFCCWPVCPTLRIVTRNPRNYPSQITMNNVVSLQCRQALFNVCSICLKMPISIKQTFGNCSKGPWQCRYMKYKTLGKHHRVIMPIGSMYVRFTYTNHKKSTQCR